MFKCNLFMCLDLTVERGAKKKGYYGLIRHQNPPKIADNFQGHLTAIFSRILANNLVMNSLSDPFPPNLQDFINFKLLELGS